MNGEAVVYFIKKACANCIVLNSFNIKNEFEIIIDGYYFTFSKNGMYCSTNSILYKGKISRIALMTVTYASIELNDNTPPGKDRSFSHDIRFSWDSTVYATYNDGYYDLPVELFSTDSTSDYFNLCTLTEMSYQSFSSLCKIYSYMDSIKDVKGKIKFGTFSKTTDSEVAYNVMQAFLKFNIEKELLNLKVKYKC